MFRLRWNLLMLVGVFFFVAFSMWLNGAPMGEDNPFNDGIFTLFVILGLPILVSYYTMPFLMKLKSSNIDGVGLSNTLQTGEPLIVIDKRYAYSDDGKVKLDKAGKPIEIYPNYDIYNLGGASAFNLVMKGGHWAGIGVFPSKLCKKSGSSVQVNVADIRALTTPQDKKIIPDHVMKQIIHEYKNEKGWFWNDEYPIYYGEVPLHVEPVPAVVSDMSERCGLLEEQLKSWKGIARQYEIEATKHQEVVPPEQPKMFEISKSPDERMP